VDNLNRNDSDRILVTRVLGGETKAFSIIISNTERLVAQIVFKMIRDNEDRKDIAQDVFLKAFNKLSTFKFESKLSTWIGQITYNTCLNYIEKKKLILFNDFNDDNNEDQSFNNQISLSISRYTDTDFLKNELAQILKIEIDTLSPLYKTLIVLYHQEELSYSEIGQITQLPEGTVKNYLYRARKALKDNLLKKYKREDL